MKRMKHESMQGFRLFCLVAALVIGLAAVVYCRESRLGLAAAQEPSVSTTPQARPSNPAAEAPDPNSPMTVRQGAEILGELRAIRLLLQNGAARQLSAQGAPSPLNVKMRVEPGWSTLGRADAPVTMVEFMDLQCPYCRRFETSTMTELKKNYIDTGKVRLVARDLPLPMHPYALGAAEAAHCAGDQGKFWELRDALLAASDPPSVDVILAQATAVGLDVPVFHACLDSNKYKNEVEKEHEGATALGIHGTPSFVIGRVADGWLDGAVLTGARPYETFQQQIDKALLGPVGPAQGKATPGAEEGPAALNR